MQILEIAVGAIFLSDQVLLSPIDTWVQTDILTEEVLGLEVGGQI